MYTPKNMLIINILDILRRYSDKNHRLSQKEILDKLKSEYQMTVDRKSIRRNIVNLIESGNDIEFSEKPRKSPVMEIESTESLDGENDNEKGKKKKTVKLDPKTNKPILEDSDIWYDYYLRRDFTDGELRLIIDSLIFSRHIPTDECKELVAKLEGLSSVYFKSRAGNISRMPNDVFENDKLFENIEIIDEAITKKCKITFKYTEFGTDKKKHIKKGNDGSERVYEVSPYQMAAREDKYYLICNYDKYEDISNYRVDRMTDIKMLEDKHIKPFEKLQWSDGRTLDLATYMKEHIYMYSSENVRVRFRIVREMISDIIDMFGIDVSFMDTTDTHVTVSTYVNERAMIQFAKNYAPDVVVLSPQSVVDKVKNELKRGLEMYEEER